MEPLTRLGNEAQAIMRNRSALFDHDARQRLHEITEELREMFSPLSEHSEEVKGKVRYLWTVIRVFQMDHFQ